MFVPFASSYWATWTSAFRNMLISARWNNKCLSGYEIIVFETFKLWSYSCNANFDSTATTGFLAVPNGNQFFFALRTHRTKSPCLAGFFFFSTCNSILILLGPYYIPHFFKKIQGILAWKVCEGWRIENSLIIPDPLPLWVDPKIL